MCLLAGIIPQLHHRYEMGVSGTKASWLAIDTDHFASTVGDAGWGCGYRNLQMLISALLKMEIYRPVMLSGECSRILGCLDTICATIQSEILLISYPDLSSTKPKARLVKKNSIFLFGKNARE